MASQLKAIVGLNIVTDTGEVRYEPGDVVKVDHVERWMVDEGMVGDPSIPIPTRLRADTDIVSNDLRPEPETVPSVKPVEDELADLERDLQTDDDELHAAADDESEA